MTLLDRILGRDRPERDSPLSIDEWISYFNFAGNVYPYGLKTTMPNERVEEVGSDYVSLARGAYKSNGPIFALCLVRMLVFSEARFQFRQIRSGRPGALFGTSALVPLEKPWPNGTTGDLLTRAIVDGDLAGNAFFARRPGQLSRLRPDWTSIVIGSPSSEFDADDPDNVVVGYSYKPGGPMSGADPIPYLVEEVAHFAPIPDPEARYRGMSWLTPVIREVMGDRAMTNHKLRFHENGATPNLVVKLDTQSTDAFDKWVEKFKAGHEGSEHAYKTLFLGAGADATVVGTDLKSLDFRAVQGAGETRLAAAAGVPPIIAGFSEGLESATYSNYSQARRRFADGTLRPLWRMIAGAFSTVLDVPAGSELWYDDRDIPFLREDEKDSSETLTRQSAAIKSLLDAGFDPDAVIDAVTANDLERLTGKHSGMFSVQLQPPGSVQPTNSANGKPPAELVPEIEGATQ